METFAEYILSEEDFGRKIEIMSYLKKKTNIFFDNSVIFKATIASLFIDTMDIKVDRNKVVTAMLLCGCKKVNNAQDMEKIKAYAKEDAKKGVYMSEGFTQMRLAHMKQYISPDRSGPKSQVMSAIQAALKEPHLMLQALEKLSGGCSANLKISSVQQAAEIFAPNGENIASYNSLGGGWTDIQTKAEHEFFGESASVYLQAYREARVEMQSSQPAPSVATSVNIRA